MANPKTDTDAASRGPPERLAMADSLCQIEILKDGHFFIARTHTEAGGAKEYKNTVFEDMLTEMVISLQEQIAD